MAETAPSTDRCLMALDIADYGGDRAELRTRLYESVLTALRDAGIDPDSSHAEERGDGVLVVPAEGVRLEDAFTAMWKHLPARMPHPDFPLQLRIALHRGNISSDRYGLIGTSLNHLFRILDSSSLRRIMLAHGADLGLILSDTAHDSLAETGLTAGFEPVRVGVKDTVTRAWVRTAATGPVPDEPVTITLGERPRSSSEMPMFVGRAAELTRLDELLLAPDGTRPRTVTITGPPGIGKTALAKRWTSLNEGRFHGVTTLDVRNAIGEGTLKWPVLANSHYEITQWLFILDDVPEPRPPDVEDVLAGLNAAGASVILTSRSAPPDAAPRVELGPLGPDEAVALLRAAIDDPRTAREAAAINDLADRLDGNPLALSVAGENLAAWPGDRVADLLDRLGEVGAHTVREVFAYTYEGLDDDLKRALRLTSVFPGFDLTVTIIAALNDVDQQEAARFLDDLSRVNLLTSADGERYRLHQTLVDFARKRCTAEDTDDDREAARARLAAAIQREHMPEGVILRDHWTLRDELSYTVFIEAIASFLTSKETRPPLTIGIKGAWGSGKTSLMRMLRRRLDPGAPADARTGRVTNRDLLREPEVAATPETVGLTTVWFNPWMYQRTEQVWAGLAHEIITQVTDRLPIVERERFWLRLNRARVDREAIRRRCYRLLFGRLLPRAAAWLGVLLIVALLGAIALGVVAASGALDLLAARLLPWLSTGAVAVAAVADLLRRIRTFWRSPVAGPLARLVGPLPADAPDPIWSDPAYRTRAGYLHAVHDDVRHVLDLVATDDRPLVVFVDDLDRCDSRTVAEVIEALNIFLAGEFPNCVFVIAMEPGAVAAHIEAAYPELVAAHRGGRLPGDWSSLGWRFLDKIVQLPLTLPAPRPEHVRGYVAALLRHDADDTGAGAASVRAQREPSVDEAMAAIRKRAQTMEDLVEAAHAVQGDLRGPGEVAADRPMRSPETEPPRAYVPLGARGSWTFAAPGEESDTPANAAAEGSDGPVPPPLSPAVQEAAMRVFAEMYDDAAAQRAVTAALPVLGSHNPREIKRFVNLFRFYSYIRLANQLAGQPVPAPPQLAKLTALVIRWPHLLAILGTADGNAVHPLTALERAAEDDKAWQTTVGTYLSRQTTGDPEPSWAADLRAFLARPPVIGPAAGML